MLTETKESFLSSQPAQEVSGSKMYVLFGMNVMMLLSLVQLRTSFDLISLKKKKFNLPLTPTFNKVHPKFRIS